MSLPRTALTLAPGPIGRDEARELARRELEKPIYHRDDPSLLDQLMRKLDEWLEELFGKVPGADGAGGGGNTLALVLIILLIAGLVGLLLWQMRGRRDYGSGRGALLEAPSTAKDHRAMADRHAAAGEWPEAIRERLRAIARDLEERAILDPRPGRTADELAEEAGGALPDLTGELRTGVRIFDEVWYGDRPGGPEGYATLTRLDERVRAARPRALNTAATSPGGPTGRLVDGGPAGEVVDGRTDGTAVPAAAGTAADPAGGTEKGA